MRDYDSSSDEFEYVNETKLSDSSYETPRDRKPTNPVVTFSTKNENRLDIDYEIKINEICLECQNNEKKWLRNIQTYKLIELVAFIIAIATDTSSLIFSVWLLFISNQRFINKILLDLKPILNAKNFFISMSIVYFIVEILEFLLCLVKAFLIYKVFKVLKLEIKYKKRLIERKQSRAVQQKDYTLVLTHESDYIDETITKLRYRNSVRSKLQSMRISLVKLEAFLNLYFVLFTLIPKVFMAVFVQIDLAHMFNNETRLLMNDAYLNESSSINRTVFDRLPQVLNCSYDSQDERFCYNQLEAQTVLYSDFMFIALLVGVSIKFITQVVLTFNFNYWLLYRIIKDWRMRENHLENLYDKCKQGLFDKKVQEDIEANQQRLAEEFFNEKGKDYEMKILNTADYDSEDDVNNAIRLIDRVNELNDNDYSVPDARFGNPTGMRTFK